MGHIYDDQNIFYSAFVKYLKKHLIKSTRRLNVYRFPKIVSLFTTFYNYNCIVVVIIC